MASKDNEQVSDHAQDVVIYIMPQRIQKKMLLDIKNATKRHGFCIRENFGEGVTHIVTQYNEYEQVLRQLQRDGATLSKGDTDALSLATQIVKLAWLSACLKAGRVVEVAEAHSLRPRQSKMVAEGAGELQQERTQQSPIPGWACQRVTPLKHCNEKLTKSLEILETYADFRGGDSDYSRALAFRRAACVLKSLPFCVNTISQVEGLRDLGGHALRVIQSILEEGYCEEVENVRDEWFASMKLFTSVYGVGPATAKKWIERGWRSVDDVRKSDLTTKDDRVIWGLAFHEDLTDPVTRVEAHVFAQHVQREAQSLLPGAIVQLTGGFRRGKPAGHDVDILLTHPDEGREKGLLPSLVQALEKKGLVLTGRLEAGSFRPDVLTADYKLTARGMLDHFEKWLGICKFPRSFRAETTAPDAGEGEGSAGEEKIAVEELGDGANVPAGRIPGGLTTTRGIQSGGESVSARAGGIQDVAEKQDEDAVAEDKTLSGTLSGSGSGNCRGERAAARDKTAKPTSQKPKPDAGSPDLPSVKRRKTTPSGQTPAEMAVSAREWKARRVDLIVSPWSQYFYALVGWTGSKHFNRDLRTYAQRERNMKLTSHGLYDFHKSASVPAGSEAEVFENLRLQYREPWERNC